MPEPLTEAEIEALRNPSSVDDPTLWGLERIGLIRFVLRDQASTACRSEPILTVAGDALLATLDAERAKHAAEVERLRTALDPFAGIGTGVFCAAPSRLLMIDRADVAQARVALGMEEDNGQG